MSTTARKSIVKHADTQAVRELLSCSMWMCSEFGALDDNGNPKFLPTDIKVLVDGRERVFPAQVYAAKALASGFTRHSTVQQVADGRGHAVLDVAVDGEWIG